MKVSTELKIEIRPIPGRNGIKEFSQNLEYFSQAHIIGPFVNPVTRKYETGLSKEDIEYLNDRNFPYNLDATYFKGKAHEFWESQMVKVELRNNPMFLYPGQSDLDFVKWKYLLANNYIYKSESEMKQGTKPSATHFIYDQGEENSIKASALQRQQKVLLDVANLSPSKKREILLLVLDEPMDNKNENDLIVKTDEIMKNEKQFAELETLLSKEAEEISLMADIKTALHKNVLKRKREGIFYFQSNLGFSDSDVLDFLAKPENQEMLLNIKSKI